MERYSIFLSKLSSISFEIDIDLYSVEADKAILSMGGFNKSTTGVFIISTAGSGNSSLRFNFSDISNTNSTTKFFNVNVGRNKISLKNLEVKINDVLVDTLIDQQVNIDTSVYDSSLMKLSYTDFWYNDGVVYSFELQNEQFQFREGQGVTTTGSLGTTATINTANAGGTQYINEQVWNVDSNKYIDYE